MDISITTFILIICFTSFITYIITSYSLNCDVICKINYNKNENFNYKEMVPKQVKKPKVENKKKQTVDYLASLLGI